jgi:hypothetical protein
MPARRRARATPAPRWPRRAARRSAQRRRVPPAAPVGRPLRQAPPQRLPPTTACLGPCAPLRRLPRTPLPGDHAPSALNVWRRIAALDFFPRGAKRPRRQRATAKRGTPALHHRSVRGHGLAPRLHRGQRLIDALQRRQARQQRGLQCGGQRQRGAPAEHRCRGPLRRRSPGRLTNARTRLSHRVRLCTSASPPDRTARTGCCRSAVRCAGREAPSRQACAHAAASRGAVLTRRRCGAYSGA